MGRMLGIEIASPIDAIDGMGNNFYVAFILRLRFVVGWLLLAFSGLLVSAILLALLLGQIFRTSGADKGNHLAVRRPHRCAHASGQVGHLPGFTSVRGKQVQLRTRRPACGTRGAGTGRRSIWRADESQLLSVWRPLR